MIPPLGPTIRFVTFESQVTGRDHIKTLVTDYTYSISLAQSPKGPHQHVILSLGGPRFKKVFLVHTRP